MENQALLHLNIHECLHREREKSFDQNELGPIVLVCGSPDVGKSKLCDTLLNYSTRCNFPLIFVDLDIGQGEILPQGNIGAVLVDQPVLPNEEKSNHCALSYFYGNCNLDAQPKLYTFYIDLLAAAVHNKLKKSCKVKAAGCIINTCGYVVKTGLEMIKAAIKAFKVNVVLVIDNELLFSQLKSYCNEDVHLAKIPKSGGAIDISVDQRRILRSSRVANYFYGVDHELHPHSFQVKFSEIRIFKIGLPNVSKYCLPVGCGDEESGLEVVPVTPSEDILHYACSISFGETESEILRSNIYGIVVITGVDTANETLVLFSPAPPPLPNNILVLGGFQFMDFQ